MNTKLTLGEKLKDLRNKRDGKLTLDDVYEATGISKSTLQRLEGDEDIRVGYQDIETLARYYDVSADYLFGLTDLQQHRNTEIDKLRLSEEAIAVLKSGMLNNRLISEFIAHEDFPQFWKNFDNGDISQAQAAEAIARLEGCSSEQASGMIDYVRSLYNEFPDTVELIKELHGEGYRLYVLSNMPREFYNYIKSFPVFGYFDGVVISSIEKMSKPDPQFFRLLLDRYDLDAGETLFVDDKIMNIQAAQQLGIQACLFDAAGNGCENVRSVLGQIGDYMSEMM